ncbi:glycosyltransferase [Diaminobutyricimonas sp. TR449]|uniref:glycosyltransferase n=1 Tax=Diaminobutyricimonas sp. TR449 TaxID=2708076 RepID=UPI0014221A84|nr:glycosyltransferase [Diaminobutyricimonas sp. TR449]
MAEAHEALEQRLAEAARVLGVADVAPADRADRTLVLLDALIEDAKASPSPAAAWLIYVAVSSVYPRVTDVQAFVRTLRLEDVVTSRMWLLRFCLRATRERGVLEKRMRIVENTTVALAHFSASNEHNSGIQRVVRRTLPVWVDRHECELTAWTARGGALRTLTDRERHRILAWDEPRTGDDDSTSTELLVPWNSTLVLAEVPDRASVCDQLTAVARFSGNDVSLIGYDAIPIVSAETVPLDMADHFAKYLTIVKWSKAVAAISNAAAGEFGGFTTMLQAQNKQGPRVVECMLPADPIRPHPEVVRSRPLVAVIGSKEPRKNHVSVLFAAERLWREGLDFELLFIGTYGWDTRDFRSWLKRLQDAGRPVHAPQRVGDDGLWRAYSEARFTVFPSLHEGYGLPVAESLAYGTPVITTGYGSTGEIAADGGCITIDPRDDEQIVDAMRRLLTDDAELEKLRLEALSRPLRTWDDYAEDVWKELAN